MDDFLQWSAAIATAVAYCDAGSGSHPPHQWRLNGSLHHATILEMNAESFRQRAAAANNKAQAETPATTITENQNEGES